MRRALIAACLASLVVGANMTTVGAARTARTGILIVDHGEPPEYNELTYESFKKFFGHLIEMGVIPSWVTAIDTGTVVQKVDCYSCAQPATQGPFIDAWLDEHPAPALFVPASSSTPAHHVVPGGPGLGEPDFFEHVGLQIRHEWQLMGGRSPNFDQKLPKKTEVIRRLGRRYPGVPVRVGYGIDPRLNGGRQDLATAVTALVERDRVDRIVVGYHGVGFSDIMQTHMIHHEIVKILEELGSEAELAYARPIGASPRYIDAVVGEVKRELALVPERASVAIHLSGHGLSTTMCGDYDCGGDSYHAAAAQLFRRTRRAIDRRVDRAGRFGVFHVYGDGGEGEDDPQDLVDGPLEALAERKSDGFRYVIDIPFEFDSDSRDTLIVLRQGYGRPLPDWDEGLESRFRHDGLRVKISNSSFGSAAKTDALEDVIVRAMETSFPGNHEH